MKDYILSICIASILCAIISSIVGKSSYASMVKMICGAFLCITVISPLKQLDLKKITDQIELIQFDSQQITTNGKQMAMQAVSDNISERAQAYILDKAASYGATITVEIIMDQNDPYTPYSAVIQGAVSPFCKAQLQCAIEEDIGIKRENQVWK